MSKRNQNRSARDTLRQISIKLDYLANTENEKDLRVREEIKKDIAELNLFFKGTKRLISIIFLLLIVAIGFSSYTIYQYKEQNFISYSFPSKKADSIVEAIRTMRRSETESDIAEVIKDYKKYDDNTTTLGELLNENNTLKNNRDSISILSLITDSSSIAALALGVNDSTDISNFPGITSNDTINEYLQSVNNEDNSKFMLLGLHYDNDRDIWYVKDRKKPNKGY